MAITVKPNGEAEVLQAGGTAPQISQEQKDRWKQTTSPGFTSPEPGEVLPGNGLVGDGIVRVPDVKGKEPEKLFTGGSKNEGTGTGSTGTSQTTTGSSPAHTTATDDGVQSQTVGSGGSFGAYESKYDEQLADLYNQITQRKPFEYNAEEDMLYQQYVDRYTKGGRLAMEDTMGKAADLTGGYGSSYGQRVGQQAYDEYMTGLNDQMLQLQQIAYGRYQDEGDRLMQQYGMLGDLADTDYARWADSYDRAVQAAGMRGEYGDFGGYRELFGDESAAKMQALYGAQVLMPLYNQKLLSPEQYYAIVGQWPVGYDPNKAGAAGGGDWAGRWPGQGMPNPYSARESAYGRGVGAEYSQAVKAGASPGDAYRQATGDRYTGSGSRRR